MIERAVGFCQRRAENQPVHHLRVIDGEIHGDHAALGCAEHVGVLNIQLPHRRRGVFRHVSDRVTLVYVLGPVENIHSVFLAEILVRLRNRVGQAHHAVHRQSWQYHEVLGSAAEYDVLHLPHLPMELFHISHTAIRVIERSRPNDTVRQDEQCQKLDNGNRDTDTIYE